jgi:hypothetical protein
MAKQFDDSIAVFARPASGALSSVPFWIGMFVLATAFVYAGLAGELGVAALVAMAAAGVGIGFFLVSQERSKLAAVKGEALVWNTAMPEIQRETLIGEVLALSRYLDVAEDQIADLQSAYIVAEDLALRQIQQEEGVPVMRHVAAFGLPFDAVTVKNGVLVCADVMFLVTPDVRQEKVDAAVRKMSAVRKSAPRNSGLETRLMLILVTQLTPADEQTLRSVLKTKRFSETPVDIDIRLLDFETLQRIYVTE